MQGFALVTGAATRIGKEIALGLAAEGINVAIHYSSSEIEAKYVLSEVEKMKVKACMVKADLLNDDEIVNLVSRASDQLNEPLNILVNNASIFEHDNIETVSMRSWDRHLGSNLKAPLFLIKSFAMQAEKAIHDEKGELLARANVINIVDQRVLKKTPEFLTYSLAKMGLWSLTQTAAQALAPHVRVNAVAPGPTLKGRRQSDDHFADQRKNTILERGSDSSEILEAVKFILKTRSMTGQLICIDGGQHLVWKTQDVLGVE